MPRVWKSKEVRSKEYCQSKGGRKGAGKLKKGWRYKKVGRKTMCVKVRKNRNCKRTHRTYDGIAVSLPCKTKELTPALKAKIDNQVYTTDKAWDAASEKGCRIIFFKSKNKPVTPVMRCPGKGALKRKFKARRRAGKVSKKFLRNIKK